jgi:DNA-binding NarL/FixJ family response regulator
MGKFKILLVEDHADFRKNMEFLLNNNPSYKCYSVGTSEEAMMQLSNINPDVVIMDIDLPGISGIECTQLIRKNYPHIQVMICTVYEDDDKIFKALKAGANGYILKRAPLHEIFDSAITPSIARKIVESFQPETIDSSNELSKRENEILGFLSTDKSIKEIADELCVSVNTVRTHVRHIYEKLQVQSRMEAVNMMRKKGRDHSNLR